MTGSDNREPVVRKAIGRDGSKQVQLTVTGFADGGKHYKLKETDNGFVAEEV